MEGKGNSRDYRIHYIHTWLVILIVFFCSGNIKGQLILNEIMASNASILADQFDEYPDWIEVYNTDTVPVQLGDFWLSDDLEKLMKWNFPGIEIAPGAYFIVFASGQDLPIAPTYWYTMINVGQEWRYYLPESNIDNSWKTSLSVTQNWNTGKSGFGYGDGDDSTLIPSGTPSVYLQKEFSITDSDLINNAALYIDYDDGFIAYLNGNEVARSASMESHGSPVDFNDYATNHEALMYNGNPPEFFDLSEHLDMLNNGSNIFAVEIHNTGTTSSDMSGIPFLLLGYETFQQGMPANNQYIIVNNEYPHSNFRIDAGGEAIYLSDNNGKVVDSLPNIQLPSDYSYGRRIDEPDSFGYFQEPTPGYMNSENYVNEYFSDTVLITVTGEPWIPDQRIYLSSIYNDDEIRYTFDNKIPDENSQLFSGPILVGTTSVIRARIFRENSLPGPVSTRTIRVGRKPTLPVISITSDPYNLFDYYYGIYELGPNAQDANPRFGANFWQNWERPVHIELFDIDNNLILDQDAGTKIFGGWTRAFPQKSMAFFARSQYGDGSFSYKLFQKKPMEKYENFLLRNSGNDWNNTHFRDALMTYMAAEMDLDHQAYEPVIKYFNGEYWGVINMREKINEHFISGNHSVYADEVNLLEGNVEVKHGSAERYYQLLTFLRNSDISKPEDYEKVNGYMDIDNYIRYWAFNVYMDNKDWPGNNIRFWNTNATGSLFRWITYDTDFGLSLYNNPGVGYTNNTLLFALMEGDFSNWANSEWATELIRQLIVNEDFKNGLINCFADGMNWYFNPNRVLPVIDSFRLRLTPEMQYHFQKWGGNISNWNNNIKNLERFIVQRPAYMRNHLMDRFNITDTAMIRFDVNIEGAGTIRINTINPDHYPFMGTYFENIPIEVKAIPNPGYIFSYWDGLVFSNESIIIWNMSSNGPLKAYFIPVPDANVSVVINEINYESTIERNTDDWIEIYNNSITPVDLSNWYIEDWSSHNHYVFPPGTVLRENSYLTISTSLPDFKRYYPELQSISGNLGFGFDNEGDGIALFDADGSLHDLVLFDTEDPWPENANGTGSTLELISPLLDNTLAENWQASFNNEGTPSEQNSCYKDTLLISDIQEISGIRKSGLEVIAYPNPFSDEIFIKFHNEEYNNIKITIWSLTGSQIKIIEEKNIAPGIHTFKWIPDVNVSSGIYFVKVLSGSETKILKIVFK